jgi:hypothetical protein
MAGFGTSLAALNKSRVPAVIPPSVITDPASGEKAWQYGNKLVPIKNTKYTSEQEDAREAAAKRKDKINFVNQFLKNNTDKDVDDAITAWEKVSGEDATSAERAGAALSEGGAVQGKQGFAKLSSGNGGRIVSGQPQGGGAGGSWEPTPLADRPKATIPASVMPPPPAPAPEETGIPSVDDAAKQEASQRTKEYQDEVDKQKAEAQSKAEEQVHLIQERKKAAVDTTKDNISYWKQQIKNLSDAKNIESQAKSATARAAEINALKKKIALAEQSLVNPYE